MVNKVTYNLAELYLKVHPFLACILSSRTPTKTLTPTPGKNPLAKSTKSILMPQPAKLKKRSEQKVPQPKGLRLRFKQKSALTRTETESNRDTEFDKKSAKSRTMPQSTALKLKTSSKKGSSNIDVPELEGPDEDGEYDGDIEDNADSDAS
jgi:hypothetical protein